MALLWLHRIIIKSFEVIYKSQFFLMTYDKGRIIADISKTYVASNKLVFYF